MTPWVNPISSLNSPPSNPNPQHTSVIFFHRAKTYKFMHKYIIFILILISCPIKIFISFIYIFSCKSYLKWKQCRGNTSASSLHVTTMHCCVGGGVEAPPPLPPSTTSVPVHVDSSPGGTSGTSTHMATHGGCVAMRQGDSLGLPPPVSTPNPPPPVCCRILVAIPYHITAATPQHPLHVAPTAQCRHHRVTHTAKFFLVFVI